MTTDARPTYDAGYDPAFARLCYAVLHAFCRVFFRFELRGAERVPRRTCILAGNHSGIGIADVLTFAGTGHTCFRGRRMVGMMHDLFARAPILGRIVRAFGAVSASREAARAALRAGIDVVTYPGGSFDSCRPFTDAREVVFGPRRGYVRLALETGVPVVPVATIGSAYTYLLLPIGDALARLVRLRKITRDERLPVPLGLALPIAAGAAVALGWISAWWLLVALACLVIPNPVRITTEILEPIDVAAETAHLADPEARVEHAHRLVHGALQRAVAELRH